MKDEFIKIFTDCIHREGASALLAWLEKSDFFTAPASTKYHSSYEGGLCAHSVNVYNRLSQLTNTTVYMPEGVTPPTRETIAVVALLHDVCKVNYYKPDTRNVKNAAGVWEQVPYYSVDDKLPYGHGEKSVYMASGFMRLSREESMAIRWHMGSTVSGENAAPALKQYPLALMLHIADMQATFIDERGDI